MSSNRNTWKGRAMNPSRSDTNPLCGHSRGAHSGRLHALILSAGLSVLLSTSLSYGGPVAPGDDLWITPIGGSWDLATIPAGTFTSAPNGEPSLAYTGPAILFMGSPLASNNPAIPPTDTVVRRTDAASVFCGGPPETVPIEIVALSLVSINPITVSYPNDPPEQWNVGVCKAPGLPATGGSMTIRHECSNGGSYDATLPVRAQLTFTRVGPLGSAGPITIGPISFVSSGWWTHTDPGFFLITAPFGTMVDTNCDGGFDTGIASTPPPDGFFPGLVSANCSSCSIPGTFRKPMTAEEAMLAAHGVFVANRNKPEVVGACCVGDPAFPLGTCFMTGQTECQTQFSGLWMGTGIQCTPNPCTGNPSCGDGGCDPTQSETPCLCPLDCGPPTASEAGLCNDGIDNDCDGSWDCGDPDCFTDPVCGGSPYCPVPSPTSEVTCPAALQATDCVIDDPSDFACLVESASFVVGGSPTIETCACFTDNPGCGPVQMIPSPSGGYDVRCPGPCPPGASCYIHFNDGSGPVSQDTDFMNSSAIPAGVLVTCGCVLPDCEPNATGTGCIPNTCPAPEICQPKCAKVDPATGESTVIDCDCSNPTECHLEGQFTGGASVAGPGPANPCVVPDNGGGTIFLPPAGCGYLSPDDFHMILDGLPVTSPPTTIQVAAEHKFFFCQICVGGSNDGMGCKTNADCPGGTCGVQNPVCSFGGGTPGGVVCDEPGGSLGGEKECSHSTLELEMTGTGNLAGFSRTIPLPVAFETHTAPRAAGQPVQSFDTDMFRLSGQRTNPAAGDPDFDLLRITAGTNYGLPSPGHTTLTLMPGGNWAVDSFFDISYRIDFVGRPGGALSGMSGSTTGTIRMATGAPMACKGVCPPKTVCKENRTVNADGTITVCCDCIPLPPDPHQTVQGTSITFDSTDVPPIPAGFFYPGSQPFMGTVNMTGGPADTLIQRSAEIICPCAGLPPCPCDPVQTEIVALDLVSVAPIVVNPGGTMWDVHVGLSVVPPQPQGTLNAVKTHANGGTYDAEIRVLPRITFTEVGSFPPNIKTIDYGLPPVRPPIRINFFGANWVENLGPGLVGTILAPNDGDFVPGVWETAPPDLYSQIVVQATGNSKGGGVSHPVGPVPLCPLPLGQNDPCAPFQARDCRQTVPGLFCVPTVIQQLPGLPPQVIECGCSDQCHVDLNAAGQQYCVNLCPDPLDTCVLNGTDSDMDGVDDLFNCICQPPPDCAPNSLGTGCNPITCPVGPLGLPEKCQPKCALLDPATGQLSLSDCDCVGVDDCHMLLSTGAGGAAGSVAGPGGGIPPECVVADNGSGTVTLPPAGCDYLSPDQFHEIVNGLPAGVTIEIAAIHRDFICGGRGAQAGVCNPPVPGVDCVDEGGGNLGGDSECSESKLVLNMRGEMGATTAGPATFAAAKTLPVSFETHTAPRTPGNPVQSFDTDMFRLMGQLPPGDPDFDLLRITAGTGFGMPSPGHTTLTQLPGGNWAVDSFFDISYEIEFVGKPGGLLGGMSGSTTGTIRMATKRYKCVGDCPDGTVCRETRTPIGALEKICCECVPDVCEPNTDKSGCTDFTCPCFGECIGGSYCDDPECCLDPNNCVCYTENAQESIELCANMGNTCFGSCVGGSYCDDPADPPSCWVNPAGAACYAENHHYSIYLCGSCFGECINGSYCDGPNPACCLEPGNCQCYSPTHPNSIKLCAGLDKCRPKCVKYNQATGQVTVETCDCAGDECYATFPGVNAIAGPGGPCEVVDNGSGSVDLPPAGCDYLTADQVHKIIDGLPPNTEIHLAPIHKDFICHKGQQGICSFLDVDCKEDGGDLGGEKECSESTLEFQLTGTGALAGWNRIVSIPNTSFETHVGKRKPFEPVQSFPTEMFRLFGQIQNPAAGDPDFDLLRITAGKDYGMPSPGHTTLTQLPGGNWAVDSFFDIVYRIDFVGSNAPGSHLAGRSGSTTATIRMQTTAPFKCTNTCPPGKVCKQTTTQPSPPDGTMTVCCDCVDAAVCEPKPDGLSCTNNTCPPGVICKPKKVECAPPPPLGNGACLIVECDCLDGDPCHVELPPAGATEPVCVGGCPVPPPNNTCVRQVMQLPGPGGGKEYSCRCSSSGVIVWDPDLQSVGRATRSLRFSVLPSAAAAGTGMAIEVTMVDLMNPVPPNLPQFPPPNFSAFEAGAGCTDPAGCARWVGRPGTFYETQGPPLSGPYRAARLQCSPFYWDWATETAVNPIVVVGAEIIPSSAYSVRTYGTTCKGVEAGCDDVSDPVSMYTRRTGDVDAEYNPPSATNQPNAIDVAQLVNKFKGLMGSPDHYRAQLQANLPELNASINALDIVAAVDAVKGFAYAFSGPCPCPSTVACGLPCAGCPGLCVKTCNGGDNDGEPCINNNHCPGGGTCAAVGTCRDACGRCSP